MIIEEEEMLGLNKYQDNFKNTRIINEVQNHDNLKIQEEEQTMTMNQFMNNLK